jgi:hypothetical protein
MNTDLADLIAFDDMHPRYWKAVDTLRLRRKETIEAVQEALGLTDHQLAEAMNVSVELVRVARCHSHCAGPAFWARAAKLVSERMTP